MDSLEDDDLDDSLEDDDFDDSLEDNDLDDSLKDNDLDESLKANVIGRLMVMLCHRRIGTHLRGLSHPDHNS